jgi:outer membrane phospholipase A
MSRREISGAWMVGLGLAMVILACYALCARAEGNVRFRQHMPMYIATDYSTSDKWEKDSAPYLKAQASMAASVLREPLNFGPVKVDPQLAFTWRAVEWPVGAFSSPITESNYLPEAFIRINEDDTGWFNGGRIGWLHNSTGTDSSSGSIDRVLLESKFGYTLVVGESLIDLHGYVRGWYTVSTGAETAGIEDYINFAAWSDAGGEVQVIAEGEMLRAVVTLGLSYQHYEVYIPFADAYDLSLFGQLWNGYADGIVDYADRHTSGGVGIALVR